jgi:hypothetical protein
VKSTGESACVYPPQPLESQTKLGSQSTKRVEPEERGSGQTRFHVTQPGREMQNIHIR